MAASLRSNCLRALRIAASPLRAPGRNTVTRDFHASSVALARQSRRGVRATVPKTRPSADVDADHGDDDDDDDDVGDERKEATFFTKEEIEANPELLEKLAADGDDVDDMDDETREFVKEVEELFALEAKDFGRRLDSLEVGDSLDSDDDEEDADAEEIDRANKIPKQDADAEEIDRANKIPKRRLLRVLEEFDAHKPRTGKNAESMPVPKTKMMAPLEKKEKKVDPERISHRQERVEMTVMDFVQRLLLDDADATESDVFAHIVDASVSPDLRRVVLFWEPARRNSTNQTIAKRKVEGVQNRLEKRERWVRSSVTRHLNLKYSPIIQFKRRKTDKKEEAMRMFDNEMAWLERFK
ncbi:hypothetical protein P43SY_003121 [Pythium insidiosum]|uniref:Ribosome-binding factor A n=1 Tax=Pythium insidiosum TaxID=114742 RepID=A0AAD5M8I1_PYTIN|nr:hypothetical protein P43SY_003121 [Pythium insidiosum]